MMGYLLAGGMVMTAIALCLLCRAPQPTRQPADQPALARRHRERISHRLTSLYFERQDEERQNELMGLN